MKSTIDALVEALEFVVERFKPNKANYIFSQRLALDKAESALALARAEHPSYFPTRPLVAQHSPTGDETTTAFNLGAGRPAAQATDAERRQFEAWMAGHNWQCAPWDGRSYGDVFTRTTWAAWRDRGALARAEQAEPVIHADACGIFDARNTCTCAAPPPPKRAPLSEEKIKDIFFINKNDAEFWWERKHTDAVALTRAIEAAHGITPKEGG